MDPAARLFDWLWYGWIAYFVIVEGVALYRGYSARYRGGTLSEHAWIWFGTAPGYRPNWWGYLRRAALVAGLAWLAVHFISGGRFA